MKNYSFDQATPQLQKAITDYCEEIRLNQGVMVELQTRAKADGRYDYRDFNCMVGLLDPEGNTPEARKADLKEKIIAMQEAFIDPDPKKCEPYLKMMCDFRTNFDPRTVNMEDPAQLRKLLCYCSIGQTMNTMAKCYPDFYKRYYDTLEKRALHDAIEPFADAVSIRLSYTIQEFGYESLNNALPVGLTLPSPMEGYREIYEINIGVNEEHLEREKARMKGLHVENNELVLPVPSSLLPFISMKNEDIESVRTTPLARSAMKFHVQCVNQQLRPDCFAFGGKNEANLSQNEFIFVDGVPFYQYLKTNYGADKVSLNDEILTQLMLGGEHRVELAFCTPDANNEFHVTCKPLIALLQPDEVKKQREAERENHNWLRKLFDWGPFKIHPTKEEINEEVSMLFDHQNKILTTYRDDAGKEQRHSAISSSIKNLVITRKQTLEEDRKREQAASNARTQRNKTFAASLEQYKQKVEALSEDELLYAVGAPVKDGYNQMGRRLQNNQSLGQSQEDFFKERLDGCGKIAARMVLLTKLIEERKEFPNGDGPIEQSLKNGNGQLEERIEAAANSIAADTKFRDLLHPHINTNNDTYKDFVNNGGVEQLNREYVKAMVNDVRSKQVPDHKPDLIESKQNISKELSSSQVSLNNHM